MTNHAIVVVGETTHAGELFAAGLTDAEIANELGLTLAEVCRLPEYAGARLGPVHVARVERALLDEALPSVTWKEASSPLGVVRLEAERRPNPVAARALLAAIEPERYGDRVDVQVTQRYVVELPAVAQDTAAWLASLPLAGRGATPTGGADPDGNAPSVPSPADFQKKSDIP